MAKPIPYNRRWLQNQQALQAPQEGQERNEPTPNGGVEVSIFAEGERAQRLFELLRVASERMIPQPQPSDDGAFDPAALVCEYLVPQEVDAFAVIHARYDTQCVGCGQPIRRGDPITRHPRWNVWVHAGCRDRQQRALVRSTIPARYSARHAASAVNLSIQETGLRATHPTAGFTRRAQNSSIASPKTPKKRTSITAGIPPCRAK
jgi:hypothetical protein